MLWKSALYGAFSSTLLATLHTSSRDTSSYESDGLSAFASLDKRSSRPPANWNHYAEKGWKLYNKWEAKPDVNDPFSWSVRDECAYGLEPSTLDEVPRPAFDLLPELGIVPCNETTGFEKIEVSWPKVWPKEKRGNFTTCTNAKYGIFVAADNVRGPLPNNKNYSQIAWWTWQTAVDHQKWRTAVNDNGPRYQDLDYSGLRYFFRNNIANDATRDILGYATNEGGEVAAEGDDYLAKIYTYRPTDPKLARNPFWALLDSPNGIGIISMLMERKGDMKGNGITSLRVHKIIDGSGETSNLFYVMWATIEPMLKR